MKGLNHVEVIEQREEKINYLVTRRHPNNGFIVLFFSANHGVVIDPNGMSGLDFGTVRSDWCSCKILKSGNPKILQLQAKTK